MTTDNKISTPAGIILSYHRISSGELDPWGMRVSLQNFRSQLAMLRNFGTPVSLPEFAAAYQSGQSPERSIVITFDDGYVDNLNHALPLLQEFNIPATVFIPSGYLGKPYFWWEALEHVFLRPNSLPATLTLELDTSPHSWNLEGAANYTDEQYVRDREFHHWRSEPGTRIRLYHEVYERLWPQEISKRLSLVSDITQWAGMDSRSFAQARPLSNQELKRIAEEELITIGAHSVNHLPLDEKPLEVQEFEILGSRDLLEKLTGKPVDTFAYPHGKYDSLTTKVLKKNFFGCACTTEQFAISDQCDPLQLPRFHVKDCTGEQMEQNLREWLGFTE